MRKNILEKIKAEKNLFEKNCVQNVYLVGSFARGDENKNSDIDLIYSVKKGKKISLFNIGNLIFNLEKKFGRHVDLINKEFIKPELKIYLEKDKILVF